MCNYLSFCGDLQGEQFWFEPNLMSHAATQEYHKLTGDSFREFEWLGNEPDQLSVRVHADDPHDEKYLRACVWAQWPNRKALEDWLIANVPGARIEKRFAEGGYGSTLTGGDHSTLIFWFWTVNKYRRVVGLVGDGGELKPGFAYVVIDGEITETKG